MALRNRENLGQGRTQREVEEKAGIPILRLSLYERGNPISIDHLEKLAKYYGIPARELTDPESFDLTIQRTQRICQVFELTEKELFQTA